MNYTDLEVRIHSRLADNCLSSIKLWYLCRALSSTGWADISIGDIKDTFAVTTRTAHNWLKGGKLHNYFRSVIPLGNGKYRVYYRSLIELCVKRGLDNFGSVGWGTIKEVVDLKVATAQIAAEALQSSSRYLAQLEARSYHKMTTGKTDCPRLPHPEELFANLTNTQLEKPSSVLCPGVLGNSTDHKLLFVGQTFKPYGASQAGIGRRLDRCGATIMRRLKSVRKIRLAKFDRHNQIEQRILQEEYHPDAGRFIKVNGPALCANPKALGRTFKLLTNIYYREYQLSSMARRRAELKLRLSNKLGFG